MGFGLGLTIVKALADAHDALITARARPAGGLRINVTFPYPRDQAKVPPCSSQPISCVVFQTFEPYSDVLER